MEQEKDDLKQQTAETPPQPEEEAQGQETVPETKPAEEANAAAEQRKEKDDKKKKKKEHKDALAQAQAELESQKDQHLRLMAEYQNYRNRTTEEKKKIYGDAKVDCVKELLGIMDSFERALEAPCTDENYKKGVEMTFKQIQKAFEKLGITEIAALGEHFDPNLHNVIKQVDDSDYASDQVCEVFQKGYMLGDRLIRPAMVAVAV
ncbi:MAG: nucleotide exchange factor GrpE [Ruminococcus sp.]|nr:nucleotide exchange factor GrpE [Ruminococcus sp.]